MVLHEELIFHADSLSSTVKKCEAENDDLRLQLDVEGLRDNTTCLHILCKGVVEHSVLMGLETNLHILEEHPLLWVYNKSQAYLYANSKCDYPRPVVVGKLFEAHIELMKYYRPLLYNDNLTDVLLSGNGEICKGPLELMKKYQNALRGLVESNIVTVKEQVLDLSDKDLFNEPIMELKALIMNPFVAIRQCYVICKSIEVAEI